MKTFEFNVFYQAGSFGRGIQTLKYFSYILIGMFCFKMCLLNNFKTEELPH